eukprot:49856-Eustigmatos_ZCMA.PRE.1
MVGRDARRGEEGGGKEAREGWKECDGPPTMMLKRTLECLVRTIPATPNPRVPLVCPRSVCSSSSPFT